MTFHKKFQKWKVDRSTARDLLVVMIIEAHTLASEVFRSNQGEIEKNIEGYISNAAK